MADKPTCETCRYMGGVGQFYDCLRHAPITFRECGGVLVARWPNVESHQWCGDHEPKQARLEQVLREIADVVTNAARDVLSERKRQIEVEGWNATHDDEHQGGHGALATAAACYAMHAGIDAAIGSGETQQHARTQAHEFVPKHWPWEPKWWKPKDRRRNLVRAAALLIAEIERLDRRAARDADGVPDAGNTVDGGM